MGDDLLPVYVHFRGLLCEILDLTQPVSVAKLPPTGSCWGWFQPNTRKMKTQDEEVASGLWKEKPGFMTSHKEAVTVKMTSQNGGFPVMTSHNTATESQSKQENGQKNIGLYQKCLSCPDYGVTCNGPKLAALGDIMIVREFHRAIRDNRSIPMKMIYLAAPAISEATINDYFSHSVKDFKWTTVGCIDNALTAICGNRVGQPLLDHPCPASSTEIRENIAQYEDQIGTLTQENIRLQEKVTETKGKVIATREEVKEDYASRVQFLKDLCEKQQQDMDEMQARHNTEIARMDAVAADYLSRIDEKNRLLADRRIENQNLRKQKGLILLVFVIALILLTCYAVWDLVHPNMGFFIY